MAGTGWVSAAEAAGAPVLTANPQQKQAAQNLYKGAMRSFEARQFDKAFEEFRSSYETVASPNSHLMMARSLRDAGKLVEAHQEYEAVAQEATAAAELDKKYEETSRSAHSEGLALRANLAMVTFRVAGAPADAQLTVGNRLIDRATWANPHPFAPGDVACTLSVAGKADVQRTVKLAAGTEETVTFELSEEGAPASAPESPTPSSSGVHASGNLLGLSKRQWAYVAGGVGAAGFVTFGVFGVMNNARYNDLQNSCPGGQCPGDRSGDVDAGRRYQTIANVGLAVGVVGLGAGTALYFMSRGEQPKQSGAARTTEVAVGPGSVLVTGSF